MRRGEHAADVLKFDGITAASDARVERQDIGHERTVQIPSSTRRRRRVTDATGAAARHAAGGLSRTRAARRPTSRTTDPRSAAIRADVGDPFAIDLDAALLNLSRRPAGRCGETSSTTTLARPIEFVGDDDVELWQVVGGKFPRSNRARRPRQRRGPRLPMKIRNDLIREVDLRLFRVQVAGVDLPLNESISAWYGR